MSTSYIPKNAYAVCTFQLNSKPQKLITSRSQVTVVNDDLPLLTVQDKNIDAPFICKSPVNMAASFLAFGAGLLVAALLVSNPIGWVVVGSLALAVGTGLTLNAIAHKCSSPMKAGEWTLFNPTVKIDGEMTLTQISMLTCSSGGVVKPFLSLQLATSAAKEISFSNKREVGINTALSFFTGLLLPGGMASLVAKHGTVKAVSIFGGTNVAGLGITWSVQYLQRKHMRNDASMQDNTVYTSLNETADPNVFVALPDMTNEVSDFNQLPTFIDAVNEGKVAVDNWQLRRDMAKLVGLSDYKLRKSELAKEIFKDLNDGKYGMETKREIQSKYARWVGNNKKNVEISRTVAGQRFNQSLKASLKDAGTGLFFFVPFISTYFSENMRKSFANLALRDLNESGICVVTEYPLG